MKSYTQSHTIANGWTARKFVKTQYFIRVYDIYQPLKAEPVWEQELYERFEAMRPHLNLVTFEGENCRVGLNFADAAEAGKFKTQLDAKLQKDLAPPKKKRQAPSRPMPEFTQTHSAARSGCADRTFIHVFYTRNSHFFALLARNGSHQK